MGFQEKRPVIVELLCRAKFNKKINCCSNHLSCLCWSKLSRRINIIITLRLRRKTRGSRVTGATASQGPPPQTRSRIGASVAITAAWAWSQCPRRMAKVRRLGPSLARAGSGQRWPGVLVLMTFQPPFKVSNFWKLFLI